MYFIPDSRLVSSSPPAPAPAIAVGSLYCYFFHILLCDTRAGTLQPHSCSLSGSLSGSGNGGTRRSIQGWRWEKGFAPSWQLPVFVSVTPPPRFFTQQCQFIPVAALESSLQSFQHSRAHLETLATASNASIGVGEGQREATWALPSELGGTNSS